MKKAFVIFGCAVLFIMLTAFRMKRESAIEGRWTGEYNVENVSVDFEARFWSDGETMKGTIDIPREGVFDAELDWIIVDSSSIHFELVADNGVKVFDGQFKDNRVTGEYLRSQEKGTFSLSRGGLVSQ